jgi:hypothetical protein
MPDSRCSHRNAEPIDTVDGVRVGWLCPDCDTALAAGWRPDWQRNFFINSASSLDGVGAYWTDEAASVAGYDPQDVADVVALALTDSQPEVRNRAFAALHARNREVRGA